MPSHDENALIGEAQAGSATAFEELVRLYDADILRLALRMVRSEDAARDIYQESFLRAFRSIRRFRGECSFRTWLYRIVVNVCRDQARRRDTRREVPLSTTGDQRGQDWTVEAARLLVDHHPASDPEGTLRAREVRRRVAEALRLLSERERLVFELRHDQGLRLGAVAEVLETTEETARNCLYRAHQRLRAALSDLRTNGRSWPARGLAAGRAEPGHGAE